MRVLQGAMPPPSIPACCHGGTSAHRHIPAALAHQLPAMRGRSHHRIPVSPLSMQPAALAAAWPAQQRQSLSFHTSGFWRSSRAISPSADLPAAAAAATAAAAAETSQQAGVLELQQLRDQLQLYNTMSRCKEQFKPRPEMGSKVQMYVCGVTVYDYSHIGHARVYVAFDVLYRLLKHLQYDVQYVRNFTDVDDKIIRRAAESGEEPLALAGRFIREFHQDMADLGCLAPTAEPRATDFIPEMVSTISRIISHGHAYVLPEGDVYFDVASLPGYGRLSGRTQEDNRAGERVAVDQRKRGAADFALWKAAKAGEVSWPSPWGPGRPGWHIECSSMIEALCGPVIDIHGGGRDLVFPHHENELAQSQAAAVPCSCGHDHHNGDGSSSDPTPADFVRFWLHNGFVNVDSEKMSKSLGNFFTIRDVLSHYHPAALRWFLVSSHYRAPINYSQQALEEASDRVYYVYQTLADVADALEAGGGQAAAAAVAAVSGGQRQAGEALLAAVVSGLLDDVNTPQCVSALAAPLKAANDLLSTKAGRKNPQRLQLLAEYQWGLCSALELLGLAQPDLSLTLSQLKQLALTRAGMSQLEVEECIAARAAARAAKDFAAADSVRLELAAKGIMLMDMPQGTTWRPSLPTGPQ